MYIYFDIFFAPHFYEYEIHSTEDVPSTVILASPSLCIYNFVYKELGFGCYPNCSTKLE